MKWVDLKFKEVDERKRVAKARADGYCEPVTVEHVLGTGWIYIRTEKDRIGLPYRSKIGVVAWLNRRNGRPCDEC